MGPYVCQSIVAAWDAIGARLTVDAKLPPTLRNTSIEDLSRRIPGKQRHSRESFAKHRENKLI